MTACQNISKTGQSSFEEWLRTPIPEETLWAYNGKTPVESNKQAVIAVRHYLSGGHFYANGYPEVVSVDFINFEDAKTRMQLKDGIHDIPPDQKVWFIVFEESFTFSTPDGTVETVSALVSCVLDPGGGILLSWMKIPNK